MRKAMMALMIVLAGLAVFAWMQRPMPPATTAVAAPVDGNAVPEAPPARSAVGEARAPSTSAPDRRAPKAPLPLPPEGTPLAGIHDALAARARAGDNAAAMRLAFDLGRCRSRAGADDDTLDQIDAGTVPEQFATLLARMDDRLRPQMELQLLENAAFCRSVPRQYVEARGEWLLLAAERGDTEAMSCFAGLPDDFAPPVLSDAWFDWSRRWRERAPAFVESAYAGGRADALALLLSALSGDSYRGHLLSIDPLAAVMQPDPVRAAAYALVASRLGYAGEDDANRRVSALDEPGRRMAHAIADRDVRRFKGKSLRKLDFLPCLRARATWRLQ